MPLIIIIIMTVDVIMVINCRDPVIGTAAITGTVLAATAIYDVHRTLQFVGSLGVLLTIGTIPIRYNSLEVRKLNSNSMCLDSEHVYCKPAYARSNCAGSV